MSSRHWIRFSVFCISWLILMVCASGCAVVGAVAAKTLPLPTIPPKYLGLAGQSVGVMVWTDRGIQIDYPSLALDLANSVQNKLLSEAAGKAGKTELKLTTFPVLPASIARYQIDHPYLDLKNVADTAPRLGVTRLIYVEVEDFGTRAPASLELFRGSMTVSMKIVEVTNGAGKVAYDEQNIKVVFPPKVPQDGTPKGDDYRFYLGTIDACSQEIVWRVVPHQEEE